MHPITCVFSHIANFLNDIELSQLLSIKEFSEFRKIFNKSCTVKYGRQHLKNHTLNIITKENTFLSKINYFPEIFTLNLTSGMCNLNLFSYLQELNLFYVKYENKININNIKKLKKITINDCKIDLSFLLKDNFDSLIELNIYKSIEDFEDFIIKFCPKNFTNLQKITFFNTNINSMRKLKILCNTLTYLDNLKYLDLSNNDFSDTTECALFNYYLHFNKLHTLKLSNCELTCNSIENLPYVFTKQNSLKVLHLNGNEDLFCCSNANINFIEFMSLVSLEELDISNIDIPKDVLFITASIQSKILKLKMCNCHITGLLQEKLESLNMNLKFYKNLSCGRCKICYDAIKI